MSPELIAMFLTIATEFSKTPGPRDPEEGDFSGKVFLETLLLPKFQRAVEAGEKLIVNLDGVEGYATSFLEASFGGLARLHPQNLVLKTIEFISHDEPFLIDEICGYIKNARD